MIERFGDWHIQLRHCIKSANRGFHYNAIVARCWIAWLTAISLTAWAPAQEQKPKQPPVRVTFLNVCTPDDSAQKELASALARVPLRPRLAGDYEIARGRTRMPAGSPEQSDLSRLGVEQVGVSRWVRMRHDFPTGSPFGSVQYTLSSDDRSLNETLVLRLRETKDLMQVALEDGVTSAESPAALLATDTPVNRIKLERFGKSSVGLSRCQNTDQSKYEPLFRTASEIMARYRDNLGVRRLAPAELARLGTVTPAKKTPPNSKSPAPRKP